MSVLIYSLESFQVSPGCLRSMCLCTECTYQIAKQAQSLFHRVSSWDGEYTWLGAGRSEEQQIQGNDGVFSFSLCRLCDCHILGCCAACFKIHLITKQLVRGALRGNTSLDFVLSGDGFWGPEEAHCNSSWNVMRLKILPKQQQHNHNSSDPLLCDAHRNKDSY